MCNISFISSGVWIQRSVLLLTSYKLLELAYDLVDFEYLKYKGVVSTGGVLMVAFSTLYKLDVLIKSQWI
jgi:hypothetical protein